MAGGPAARLRAADPVRAAEDLGIGEHGWVVGGAVRDAARGAAITDVDFAVEGDPKRWATGLAKALGGSPFRLSAEFGTWRVVARDGAWSADFSSLRGERIEDDLRLRDFTLNACAVALGSDLVVDPLGGLDDLEAGRLVAVSDRTFEDDPLRLMRAVRQAAELRLSVAAETVALGRRSAARATDPASERTYMELRALLGGPEPVAGIGLMAELGIEAVILPELDALRGISQGPYHHLDAYEHTIEVLAQAINVESGSADEGLGEGVSAEARRLLEAELGDGISRAVGLRFAALLHDVGKAGTRMVMPNGRIGFPGHDGTGEALVREVLSRLRASRAVTGYVAALTRGHLRLGFLVHNQPLDERQIHAYLRAAHPWAVDLTLLTVADRLATRGRKSDEAIAAHMQLASTLLGRAVAWEREGPPALPIGGDELAEALGIEEGPELGRLITELEADAYAGEVRDRDSTIARAHELRRSSP